MNDCIWSFINNICKDNNCNKCKKYLSINEQQGGLLLKDYQRQVEIALTPLTITWEKIFNEYTVD